MSNLPAAICSDSLGGGAGEGAGRKHPWEGRSVPETANQNDPETANQNVPETANPSAPCYLKTNGQSEERRGLMRQCVLKGRPVADVRAVAALGWKVAARLEATEVGPGGNVAGWPATAGRRRRVVVPMVTGVAVVMRARAR